MQSQDGVINAGDMTAAGGLDGSGLNPNLAGKVGDITKIGLETIGTAAIAAATGNAEGIGGGNKQLLNGVGIDGGFMKALNWGSETKNINKILGGESAIDKVFGKNNNKNTFKNLKV